jgi:hypothetical protein
MPASPGFSTVVIKPALGELTQVNGSIPHPAGEINVSLKRVGAKSISGVITLPVTITGKFLWNNKEIALKGGRQEVSL